MTKSKSRAYEPDENKARLDDEDVEGHGKARAVEPDDYNRSRATDDEDVEGHGKARAVEPDELARATDDEDVEGHGKARAIEPDELARATEDDVEGQMMGNPLLGRELARSREQEIQRNLKAHAAKEEARPHKK